MWGVLCCGIWKGSKLFPHIKKRVCRYTHEKKTPFMCVWLRYEGCRDCNLRKQIWFYWFAKKKEKKYLLFIPLLPCVMWSFSDHTSLLKMLFDQVSKTSFTGLADCNGNEGRVGGASRGSRGRGFTCIAPLCRPWKKWSGFASDKQR